MGQVLGPRSSSSPLIAQNEMFLYMPPKIWPGPGRATQNPALARPSPILYEFCLNDFLKDSQNHGSPKYSIYVNSNRIKFMNCRIVLKCCIGGLYTYRQVLLYCFGYTKSCLSTLKQTSHKCCCCEVKKNNKNGFISLPYTAN